MNLKNILKFAVRLMASILTLPGCFFAPRSTPLKTGERVVGFVRENARDIVRQARILFVAGALSVLLVSGCASRGQKLSYGYKWACTGKCEVPFFQADSKCAAQANAVPVSKTDRYEIKYQCLAGEGYNAVRCQLTDPSCKSCNLFDDISRPLPSVCW